MGAATTVVSPRRLGLPPRALGDERLARLAATGDRDALAAIFERHHQALYRYCRALLGSAEDAEDALQNAMARVVRALPGETRELALKPWLYRIAHNEAMRIAGRRRPQTALEEAPEVAARPDAEDRETRERLSELLADLRELSERQRGALVLRELEGASFAHIASVFGGGEAAAKQTVYEARVCLADFARGRAMRCDEVTRALSDGDRRRLRGRPVRGHLRACEECSTFAEALRLRPQELRALTPPLAAPAAAALLAKLLGGGGGGAVGGLGASSAAGGALASISMPSIALKGLATIAVAGGVAAGVGEVAPSRPGPGGEPAAITEGEAGARAGVEDGRRDATQRRRGDRDSAEREAGGARDERDPSAAQATRGERGDRSDEGKGRAPAADRRLTPASGELGSSPGGGFREFGRGGEARPGRGGEARPGGSGQARPGGSGGARPGSTPAGDAPRPSAPSPPAGLRPAPAPRNGATAPSATPPRAPAVPSPPDVVIPTAPAEASAGRGPASRP